MFEYWNDIKDKQIDVPFILVHAMNENWGLLSTYLKVLNVCMYVCMYCRCVGLYVCVCMYLLGGIRKSELVYIMNSLTTVCMYVCM